VTTPPAPRLVVHDALGRRIVTIDRPVFTIGRRPGNSLQLAGSEVSRDHAEIVRSASGLLIRDRASRYGTFVNGARITEHPLADGDRIECGRLGAALVFLLGESEESDDAPTLGAGDLRQVATLLEALRQMGTRRVLDEVLALVLDAAIESSGAERGFIMLPGPSGALEMKLARAVGGTTLPPERFQTSRRIPEDVFSSGQTTVVTDLFEGDLAALHTGTVALGIRHVLCAPLRLVRYVERADRSTRPEVMGVLYLDSREKGRLFSMPARTALEALAAEAAVAIENARLYEQAVEKERLDAELSMASHIQQALLPEGRRVGAFFEAVASSIPSRAIGGDFFDFQEMGMAGPEAAGQGPRSLFRFGLGDVTGKGPPAALLTALVQGVLATQALTEAGPDRVIALVNRILLSRPIESRYLTLFLAVLAADGTLTYCNAAQNPPLLFGASGIRRLDTGGTLVGAFPESIYEREDIRLVGGDTVVAFSDGITEAMNPAGEEFGEDRVRRVVADALTLGPEGILAALLDAVRTFTGHASALDDLTAMVVRYVPPGR
jgi:serine phosphatase RsbU (regulator of sigma subunit)